MKNKFTQEKLIPHVLWANQNKVAIQAQIHGGKTVTELANERGIPATCLRNVLTGVGIKHGHQKNDNRDQTRESAILTVLLRLAKGLNVPHDEIMPFVGQ